MFETHKMFEGFINIKYLTSGIYFKKELEPSIDTNRKMKYYRLSDGFKQANDSFQTTLKNKTLIKKEI